MKNKLVKLSLIMVFCISVVPTFAQNIDKEAIIGIWDIQGTLMGDETGWLVPHKPSNTDCESDHTVFAMDQTAREVKFNDNCEAKENAFEWKMEGKVLTLTKGERSIQWHIHSIEDGKMTVGVQVRPGSENRMYVVYKKRN